MRADPISITLKYGVVVARPELKKWQLECIRELESSRLASLSCVVRAAERLTPDTTLPATAFHRFCQALDAPSQSTILLSKSELNHACVLEIEAWALNSERDLMGRVRELGLDFLLSFAPKEVGVRFHDVPKYGVWQFVHGDIAHFISSVPCFWETYHNHDVIGSSLLRLRGDSVAGVVLKSGYFATAQDSYRRKVETVFASMTLWPAQVCRDIQRESATYFDSEPMPNAPIQYGVPSAGQILTLRLLEAKNEVARYVQNRFFSTEWAIGLSKEPPVSYVNRDGEAVFSKLKYTRGSYLADPFLFRHNGQVHIFCEQVDHRNQRGSIVTFEASEDGALQPRKAIEEPFHLSYPFVFEHEGAILCVPETAQDRTVSLYRALDFPHQWAKVHTLINNFAGVDSTLVKWANKWWLFCTCDELSRRGFNSHLYIWHASDLFGSWTPHKRNPVKIDVRSSRAAGRFFEQNGRLYRPTQDCSRTYGGAININRIDKLTELDFQESVVGRIRPPSGKYNSGIHTITAADALCVVDAKRYVFEPASLVNVTLANAKYVALRLGVPKEVIDFIKAILR